MDTSSLPVVSGGFPSPADPFFERQLNTQDLFGSHTLLDLFLNR